ncbi:anaerobic ribonucleoside-triphosphate reductase activating protein [Candidatus Bathyarchaeota archaeon]|nr:anaerobic ribonucleoside-triphosphate reductase activating protein [Candidatus Bathyarchaeota archaeon]
MKFSGIQKTSLIDFPDNVSTVLFTAGCNLRCPYCHNWRIVLEYNGPFLSEEDAVKTLEERKTFIEHVVITGGEPTIQEGLPGFLSRLKALGYKLKLDSNGMRPEVLEKSLAHLDYVAVDVKTSLDLYPILKAESVEGLLKTIHILKKSSVDYEFRCTAVPGFVNEDIVHRIGEMVKGARRFAFQQFIPGDTLDPAFNSKTPYTKEKISKFADIMASYVEEVSLRV